MQVKRQAKKQNGTWGTKAKPVCAVMCKCMDRLWIAGAFGPNIRHALISPIRKRPGAALLSRLSPLCQSHLEKRGVALLSRSCPPQNKSTSLAGLWRIDVDAATAAVRVDGKHDVGNEEDPPSVEGLL